MPRQKKEWLPKEDDKGTAEDRGLKVPSGSEVPQLGAASRGSPATNPAVVNPQNRSAGSASASSAGPAVRDVPPPGQGEHNPERGLEAYKTAYSQDEYFEGYEKSLSSTPWEEL